MAGAARRGAGRPPLRLLGSPCAADALGILSHLSAALAWGPGWGLAEGPQPLTPSGRWRGLVACWSAPCAVTSGSSDCTPPTGAAVPGERRLGPQPALPQPEPRDPGAAGRAAAGGGQAPAGPWGQRGLELLRLRRLQRARHPAAQPAPARGARPTRRPAPPAAGQRAHPRGRAGPAGAGPAAQPEPGFREHAERPRGHRAQRHALPRLRRAGRGGRQPGGPAGARGPAPGVVHLLR